MIARLPQETVGLFRGGVRLASLIREALAVMRPAGPDAPAERGTRFHEAARRLARAHALNVEVTGDLPPSGAVLAANHVSYLDPLAIASLVPCIPVAKVETLEWPLIGRAMAGLGVLFVSRGCPFSGARVLFAAEQVLARGTSVLVFPEGTTTRGEDVGPFRRGLFAVAQRLGAPVVPVTVRYASTAAPWVGDEPFLPHYLTTCRGDGLDVRLNFGPPLTPSRSRASEEVAESTRQHIRRVLQSISRSRT